MPEEKAKEVQKVDIVAVPPELLKGPGPADNVKNVKNLPPDTTAAEDRTTAGQRRVNLVWELTQAIIAMLIAGATVYAILNDIESAVLSSAFTLVIALYFVRTNHTKTGGVGGTESR